MTLEKLTDKSSEPVKPAELVQRLRVIESDLPTEKLIEMGLRGKRWSAIPVEKIDMSDSINDLNHFETLGDSMFGKKGRAGEGFGQITPITAAALPDETRGVKYKVTDGSHRTEACIQRNEPRVDAIELLGLSDEEIFDLRIIAASYRSTSFARTASFMEKSFEESKWFKQHKLTILQAFSLAVQGTSGIRLQLNSEQSEELKEWVDTKSRTWGKKPGSIFSDLNIISKADPELNRQVRVGGGGHGEGKGVINPARLRAIVNALPNMGELQHTVAEAVVMADLDAPETDAVARMVAHFQDDQDTVELIRERPRAVAAFLGNTRGIDVKEKAKRMDRAKEILDIGLFHGLEPEETALLAQQVACAQGNEELIGRIYENPRQFISIPKNDLPVSAEKTDGRSRQKGSRHNSAFDRPLGKDHSDSESGYVQPVSIRSLTEENNALREALTKIRKIGSGTRPWIKDPKTWWKMIPDLGMNERRAFELVVEMGLTPERAARDLKITPHQVLQLVNSGASRYLIDEKSDLQDFLDRRMYGDQIEKIGKSAKRRKIPAKS